MWYPWTFFSSGLRQRQYSFFGSAKSPRLEKPKMWGISAKRLCIVPGHPVTTVLFVAICWWVVANTIYRYPQNSLIGFAILLAGVPVYWMWSRKAGSPQRGGDTERGKHQNPN